MYSQFKSKIMHIIQYCLSASSSSAFTQYAHESPRQICISDFGFRCIVFWIRMYSNAAAPRYRGNALIAFDFIKARAASLHTSREVKHLFAFAL